jgi:thiol-disulfide isomerase/thioredoxin
MVKRKPKRNNGPLIAWVSIGIVVALVLTFVLIKELSSSNEKLHFGLASPTVFNEVTHVPASVFNTVGVDSSLVDAQNVFQVTTTKESSFTQGGLPASFYFGAEYCPFCAATRWGMIIALSRFGTFDKLYNMFSSSTDYAPNTPTFSLYKTSYSSPYLAFTGYEVENRNKQPLDTPPADIMKLVNQYNPSQSFPFLDIANKTFIVNSAFDPNEMAEIGDTTQSQVAGALTDTSSPITQAIISTANYVSAGICASAKNPPASVCNSSGVKAAAAVLGLKV